MAFENAAMALQVGFSKGFARDTWNRIQIVAKDQERIRADDAKFQ